MNKRYPLMIALFSLWLVLAACGSGPLQSSSQGSNILFQDDFSKQGGGWNLFEGDNGSIDYQNGGLRFVINKPDFDYWSVPGLKFSDVAIDVDAVKSNGPDDNDFGVICRYQDDNNFYGFLISSDGYYGITKMTNGEHDLIGMDGMQVSDAIRKSGAVNHIRAECVGDRLTLYANNQKLYEVHDSSYTSGDVGLMAGSFSTTGVEVTFDNFVVTKPQ